MSLVKNVINSLGFIQSLIFIDYFYCYSILIICLSLMSQLYNYKKKISKAYSCFDTLTVNFIKLIFPSIGWYKDWSALVWSSIYGNNTKYILIFICTKCTKFDIFHLIVSPFTMKEGVSESYSKWSLQLS